jgi:hypothetical protein
MHYITSDPTKKIGGITLISQISGQKKSPGLTGALSKHTNLNKTVFY